MFDFNLKPIPGTVPTFSRNAGSNVPPMNPQLVTTPSLLRNDNRRNTKANLPLGGGFAFGSGSSLFAEAPAIISDNNPKLKTPFLETKYQEAKSSPIENTITIENMKWARSLFSDIKISKNSNSDFIVIIRDKKAKVEAKKEYVEYSELSLSDDSNKDRVVRTGITLNGNIISEIVISSTSTVLFSLVTTIDTILELESTFNKSSEASQFTIKSFNFHAIGIYFAIVKAYKDMTELKSPTVQNNPPTIVGKNSKGSELLSNIDCFGHDYKCSPPSSDKIKVNIPFCGFEVDISDCCKQHDIDLWCGAGLPNGIIQDVAFSAAYLAWYTYVNAKFGACITSKLYSAASNLPFYCFIGYGIILGLTFGIIAGYIYFLGVEVGSIYNILELSTYMPWDDRHRSSCLCDGAEPTYLCNSCRNLCYERGLSANCVRCKWDCNYKDGKLDFYKDTKKYTFLNTFGHSEEDCCRDTLESCSPRPSDDACPKCYTCGWDCIKIRDKYQLVARTENPNNLPCCEGALDRDISAERDCQNKNRGKGEPWEQP